MEGLAQYQIFNMNRYQSKLIKRGIRTREKRKIILIGCEGNNKTEKNYFLSFNNVQKKYIIKFSCGNDTDLPHIVKNIKKTEIEIGFDSSIDKAFAVFDIDNDIKKIGIFSECKKKEKDIAYIPSNPCFELWFLLHFEKTTKHFNSNDELISSLKKYIPGYEKNKNYFSILLPKLKIAIQNNEMLIKEVAESKNSEYLGKTYTNIVNLIKILGEDFLNQ